MTAAATLRASLSKIHEGTMVPLLSAFPWEDPRAYAEWLSQTYHYVRHTTELLEVAAGACADEQSGLRKRLEENAAEEEHHERLLLRDLKALGRAVSMEHPVTEAFYASLYHAIEHRGPEVIVGRVLLLEGMAEFAGPDATRRATAAHGDGTAEFLRVHVAADGGETGHLEKVLQSVTDFDARALGLVGHELVQSALLYEVLVREAAGPEHPLR